MNTCRVGDDGGLPWRVEASPPDACARGAIDLVRLADALPTLGTVLWLDRRMAPVGTAGVLSRSGVLLDHPAIGVLSHCSAITVREAVTPNGPREWLAFEDRAGEVRAKLFLLPDSDYLAWDEMTASCRFAQAPVAPTRWSAHGAFLRNAWARLAGAWRARLFAFEQRRMPWRTLHARPPLRISLLGLELARNIARDEGAELVSPLYAA